MEQIIQDFVVALRSSGVRISPAETQDALLAVGAAGYADRQALKDTLAVTLAKTQDEKEIFDRCFEIFFAPDPFSASGPDLRQIPPGEAGESFSPLTMMLLTGDRAGLSMALRRAGEEVDLPGIWFFTQKSVYTQRMLLEMGGRGLEQDILQLSQPEAEGDTEKREALERARDRLLEDIREFVERQYDLHAFAATEKILERHLRRARLSSLDQQDLQRLQVTVRRAVRRLNDRYSRRRRAARRGRLDVKGSLRRNLAYQGLLFEPCWKSRRVDRPDILVLCDVSRSVANVSRFMLLLLSSLNEEVARIRSFVFCSNLVEVTPVFREHPVPEALERLQSGQGFGLQMGRTDYGQAFADFKRGWLNRVTPRSTVLILGDARSNSYPPGTDILRLIAERARRVIWLNPEPPSFWGTGDSEMPRYRPHCFLARECSTLNHLERVVDFLLRVPG